MENFGSIPKAKVRSAAIGMMFMTFFGALWSSIGIVGSLGVPNLWLLIVCAVVTLTLLWGSISLFSKARNLPDKVSTEDRIHWQKVNKQFNIVFGLEGAAIAITSVICNMTNNFDIFFPIMAIIVGVHFFPLAQLFKVKSHHVTGAVLCVLGIIALFIPLQKNISGVPLIIRSVFIGFGSAITLWANGFSAWITTLRKLKKQSIELDN